MNRRKFLHLFSCGCLSMGLYNCAEAPITERKQLKLIPESKLNEQARLIYEQIKKKEKMSDDIETLNQIKEIGKKMENSIYEYFLRENIPDPTTNFEWEYILIENKKVKNAWCMPGGKIAIYSGILDVTENINGLSAVMGHEIAHAVAKHSVERASRNVAINVVTSVTDALTGGKLSTVNRTTGMNAIGLLTKMGIVNPFNRKQETEADYLGLIFASLSGYDIRETINVWENMKEAKKGQNPPEFMSTHPSPENRIKKIEAWINEVTLKYPPIG